MQWCWLSIRCTNKQPVVLALSVGHTCGTSSAVQSGMEHFASSLFMCIKCGLVFVCNHSMLCQCKSHISHFSFFFLRILPTRARFRQGRNTDVVSHCRNKISVKPQVYAAYVVETHCYKLRSTVVRNSKKCFFDIIIFPLYVNLIYLLCFCVANVEWEWCVTAAAAVHWLVAAGMRGIV